MFSAQTARNAPPVREWTDQDNMHKPIQIEDENIQENKSSSEEIGPLSFYCRETITNTLRSITTPLFKMVGIPEDELSIIDDENIQDSDEENIVKEAVADLNKSNGKFKFVLKNPRYLADLNARRINPLHIGGTQLAEDDINWLTSFGEETDVDNHNEEEKEINVKHDDKLNGEHWEYFGDSIKPYKKCCYFYGVKCSEEEWDENGTLVKNLQYNHSGKLHGISHTWYNNGSKRTQFRYEYGVLDGECKIWFKALEYPASQQFDHDYKKVCEYEEYITQPGLSLAERDVCNTGGAYLKASLHFRNNGTEADCLIFFNDSKVVKKVYKSFHYLDNELDGQYVEWFPPVSKICTTSKGKHTETCVDVRILCHYNKGKLHGKFTKYYKGGERKIECTFVDGKLHGTFTEFYEAEYVKEQCTYENGELVGECTTWFKPPEANITNKRLMQSNMTAFNSYDKIKSRCHYQNGKLHGESNTFLIDGQLKETKAFVNGRLI